MAGDSGSESSKMELIVSKFFSKCIHVILESRYTHAVQNKVTSDAPATEDKWFNLLLRDIPPELIRTTRVSSSVQLVVDFVLLHRTRHDNGNIYLHSIARLAPSNGSYRHWDGKEGKIIERWVMSFEVIKERDSNTGGLKASSKPKTFYKKCLLMLRSLCLMVKLLPAYKLLRDLTAYRRPTEFSIGQRISSFPEPFTRDEEAQMQKYLFSPVGTSCGSLCVSVLYLSSPGNLIIEPSYQMLPHIIIRDYCGRVSVDPVCKAPRLHGNRMVTFGSKLPGKDGKPSLITETGTTTQAQLPTILITDAATTETSGEASSWTAVSVRIQQPTAEAASSSSPLCNKSHLLDAPHRPANTSPHASRCSGSLDCFRSEVRHCLNPEELRDPFQPRLSNNAVLGSMFSIFNAAAPLCQTSAFPPNSCDLQATAGTVPTKRTVKTTSDALGELQDLVELKKLILQKRSFKTPNTDSHSTETKSSIPQDSTQVSK